MRDGTQSMRLSPVFFFSSLGFHCLLFLWFFLKLPDNNTPIPIFEMQAEIWTQMPILPSIEKKTANKVQKAEEITHKLATDIVLPVAQKLINKLKLEKITETIKAKPAEKIPKIVAQKTDKKHQEKIMEQARVTQLARLRQIFEETTNNSKNLENLSQTKTFDPTQLTTYTEKIKRRVQPNIFFDPLSVADNPKALVKVELDSDGVLLKIQLLKSSGNTDWDAAVLSALERSSPLPKNIDDKSPLSFTITFRLRE